MPKRKMVKRDITREQFYALLGKAAERVKPTESDLEPLETSDVPQDDGCSEIDIHSDMTEDTSD
ncbi:MAG: hypothetical protein ABSB40_13745 [Nitrososphaeria archaeon]|jgi:hypothetical protein